MPRRRKCLVVSVMLLTNPALLSEIIEQMTVCQVACICHIQGPLHSHALNEQFYTYASKFWNNIAKAKGYGNTDRVKQVSKHVEKQDSMCIQQQSGPVHAWLKIVPY